MKLQVGVVLLGIASCQCLEPVDERDGGPTSGGSSGGSTAGGVSGGTSGGGAGGQAGGAAGGSGYDGGDPACTTAANCPAGPNLRFCTDSRPVCVNGRCLYECGAADGGQTCQTTTPECLTCSGTAACAQCRSIACTFRVEDALGPACPPFGNLEEFSVQPFSGRCGAAIVRDGGVFGVWVGAVNGAGRSLIQIPSLGGACLGSNLYTGAPRTAISCPTCTFVVMGCE